MDNYRKRLPLVKLGPGPIILALIAVVTIFGCAAPASRMLAPMIQNQVPYWDLRASSNDEPENFVSVSREPSRSGDTVSDGSDLDELERVVAGSSGNWTWSVFSQPEIDQLLGDLEDLWQDLPESLNGGLPFDYPVTNLNSAMSNMQAYSQSLQLHNDVRFHFDIFLVPKGQLVHHELPVQKTEGQWTIPFVVSFRSDSVQSTAQKIDLFSDLTRVPAIAGALAHATNSIDSLLERTEGGGEPDGFEAKRQQMCWHSVGRRLMYAGHAFALRPPPDTSPMVRPVFAEMHRQDPEDLSILAAHALIEFYVELESYLKDSGTAWPRRGTDVDRLTGLLEFCVQYLGDDLGSE